MNIEPEIYFIMEQFIWKDFYGFGCNQPYISIIIILRKGGVCDLGETEIDGVVIIVNCGIVIEKKRNVRMGGPR